MIALIKSGQSVCLFLHDCVILDSVLRFAKS